MDNQTTCECGHLVKWHNDMGCMMGKCKMDEFNGALIIGCGCTKAFRA